VYRRAALAVAVAFIVGAASLSAYFFFSMSGQNACQPLGGSSVLEGHVARTSWGAITKFILPGPSRWPNAIVAAPDGSVWFGEQAVPGVGHLLPDGSLTEYAWPPTQDELSACGFRTSIWGLALWRGMVWGTDGDGNRLIGLNPVNDSFSVVRLPGSSLFPYSLSVGPDGSLWFTLLSTPAAIGKLSQSGQVSIYPVKNYTKDVPAEIYFVNSTYAYYAALNPANGSGGLFAFDPSELTGYVVPTEVGGGYRLFSPNSVSVGAGRVWLTQHGAASIASYDIESRTWTVYPTSTENYTTTTLPYFVRANGSVVWFNEHYGNRVSYINTLSDTMTEYSEADPPVYNGSRIDNALTIALGKGGVWFTGTTGNYVGFVDASYVPPFSLSNEGNGTVVVARGETAQLKFRVTGSWSTQLRVQFSDSENYTSLPALVRISANETVIQPGHESTLAVTVEPMDSLPPGRYTLGVTVGDGLVLRTVFIFLVVR
jgi:streptogramin lyase